MTIVGNVLSTSLMEILGADQIVPGAAPSYQICKDLYLYHPLGKKMTESPVAMAQSQAREVTVQGAPDEVIEAYQREWERLAADRYIRNTMTLARVYGLASIVMGAEAVKASEPIEFEKLPELDVFFNVLDPLNTAGSLVLDQIPTEADFQKPVTVATNGERFHRSRFQVVMNEQPVYIAYTSSAFGFVGRSVYQRALYPLKSFLRSMIADDMITAKLGVLIAKAESPSGIINVIMQRIAHIKRALLRDAQTGNVMQIGLNEAVETLNMQNVDGAGTYARDNILKNIATAADMPASLLNNETMVKGFGEGTEDAKNIARYIHGVREDMAPLYAWFDRIAQYRAWTPAFYETLRGKHPGFYGMRSFGDVTSEWRHNFVAEWPSWLIEPESERIRVSDVKFQATIALLQSLLPELDPDNKVRLIEWAADTIGDNKLMFEHELDLDFPEMRDFKQQQQERMAALPEPGESDDAEARKYGKFDSVSGSEAIGKLQRAVAQLPAPRRKQLLAAAGAG